MKRPTYGKYIPKAGRNGYLRQWCPDHPTAFKDGTVLLHRKVWYDKYGAIPKGFHIHHRDGDKTNNSIDNLEVHANSQHQLVHRQEGTVIRNQYGDHIVKPHSQRQSTLSHLKKTRATICPNCGRRFTGKRSDARFCSTRCQVYHWKLIRRKGLSQFPPS